MAASWQKSFVVIGAGAEHSFVVSLTSFIGLIVSPGRAGSEALIERLAAIKVAR